MFSPYLNQDTAQGFRDLFNMIVRPKAHFKKEVMRILDEQYQNVMPFWPEDVRFVNDPKKPYTTEYVSPFPETPSALPEDLGGMTYSSRSSFTFTPVKKKWLTQEFLSAVDAKVTDLKRATDFPECTLQLNGFDMLKDIAADSERKPNDKIAIDMMVNIHIQGKKKAPAPQQ